jgi:hypothetical protein
MRITTKVRTCTIIIRYKNINDRFRGLNSFTFIRYEIFLFSTFVLDRVTAHIGIIYIVQVSIFTSIKHTVIVIPYIIYTCLKCNYINFDF